jgi:hypothetical protein
MSRGVAPAVVGNDDISTRVQPLGLNDHYYEFSETNAIILNSWHHEQYMSRRYQDREEDVRDAPLKRPGFTPQTPERMHHSSTA